MRLQFMHASWYLLPLQGVMGHSTWGSAPKTSTYDVCIIGGGASGSYAAVRLQEMGKSVVVIEERNLLGGHTNTYTDPATNATIDYGVQLFHNVDLVKNYFARFDVPLALLNPGVATNLAIDFQTGKPVEGYVDPTSNATAVQEAMTRYAIELSKYPFLAEGFYLPQPVPEDLLISFGDFVKKHQLDAIANMIFNYGQGFGDFLSQPAIYVLKYFSLNLLQLMQTGFLTTARGNNGEIYEKIQQKLGPNVLLGARVIKVDRKSKDNVKLVVRSARGQDFIQAKRVLVTMPPLFSNMQPFDLNSEEASIFKQFRSAGYYTGILKSSALTQGTQYNNIGPNTPHHIPTMPGIYNIISTRVSGLFTVTYGDLDGKTPVKKVQEKIIKDLTKMKEGSGSAKPSFVAFDNHSPYELTVSPKSIAAGFYGKLYALQGKRNTWFTGAAFQMHDSSSLWNYTESLLPGIVANI